MLEGNFPSGYLGEIRQGLFVNAVQVALLTGPSEVGDDPPALKWGGRLGRGHQAPCVWHSEDGQSKGGLDHTFVSLRSPQGPCDISVCVASNSCLTTAFLKGKKAKKAESLKFRHCLLLLSIALVKVYLSEALQTVTSHGSAPVVPPLSHNNLHSWRKTEPFFLPISLVSFFINQHSFIKRAFMQ